MTIALDASRFHLPDSDIDTSCPPDALSRAQGVRKIMAIRDSRESKADSFLAATTAADEVKPIIEGWVEEFALPHVRVQR